MGAVKSLEDWRLASNPAHTPAGAVLPTDASAHLLVDFLNYTNKDGDWKERDKA